MSRTSDTREGWMVNLRLTNKLGRIHEALCNCLPVGIQEFTIRDWRHVLEQVKTSA